jgi:hypothetical protein
MTPSSVIETGSLKLIAPKAAGTGHAQRHRLPPSLVTVRRETQVWDSDVQRGEEFPGRVRSAGIGRFGQRRQDFSRLLETPEVDERPSDGQIESLEVPQVTGRGGAQDLPARVGSRSSASFRLTGLAERRTRSRREIMAVLGCSMPYTASVSAAARRRHSVASSGSPMAVQ